MKVNIDFRYMWKEFDKVEFLNAFPFVSSRS